MNLTKSAQREITQAATSIKHFSKRFIGIVLRPYQIEAAEAIIDSALHRKGLTFIVIFSRQSGKDEMIAIIFLYLLFRFIEWGADMVCAQPTFKPQTVNAMERLKKRGINFGRRLRRTAGYIMRLGQATVAYFSAEPTASQVGATGERLIVMNEAQDIEPEIYDKRFSPMGASGNATRVFSGTSWTSATLLSREKKAALALEAQDGIKRVFIADCIKVGKANKWYARYVASEILKLGRQHPFIRTQYFCEEIDAQAGMFNARRLALMTGDQPPQNYPTLGHIYAFLVDVGGMDETLQNLEGMGNPGRDSTTLSIVSVDLSTLETLQSPTYRVVHREAWQGQNHLTVFGKIKAFADVWSPQYIVVDATGVGEGLWAMLDRTFPTRVLPIKFTQQTKSEMGYGYLAIIETGRVRLCDFSEEIRIQYEKCQSEILPGPQHTMRWGVKDGTRHEGELVHDDHVLADSMTSELDKLQWMVTSPTLFTDAPDPLRAMDRNY